MSSPIIDMYLLMLYSMLSLAVELEDCFLNQMALCVAPSNTQKEIMNTIISPRVSSGFKVIVDTLVQQRQDYLAGLQSESSMVKITYKDKTLLCVYMRHTQTTVTVKTSKETVDHLWNNGPLCLSGPYTDLNVKFKLSEVHITKG